MDNSWTRENLYTLGIFDLRVLARDIGVKSPTILKKEDLIDQILLITSGEQKPHIKKNNKGRPPKEAINAQDIVSNFFPVQKEVCFKSNTFDDWFSVESGNEFYSDNKQLRNGYLNITKDNHGFLFETFTSTDSYIFVNEKLIEANKLSNGDFVSAYCKKISGNGKESAIEIVEINGKSAKEYISEAEKFESLVIKKPNSAVNGLKDVLKGQKYCFTANSKDMQEKSIVSAFNACKCKNKILLNLNSLEEDYIYHTNSINYKTTDDDLLKLRTLELVVGNALSKAKMGEDQIVFIMELGFLPNALSCTQFYEQRIDIGAMKHIKQIILNGKCFENGGSLTIVFGINKHIANFNIIAPELQEVSNVCEEI